MIKIQEKLSMPIGEVMRRMGAKPLRSGKKTVDIIVDPHDAFGRAFLGEKTIPLLPFFEKTFLRKK